ncbi:streptophobe family protein [Streptomyces sp. NPDC046915]|uniref:streptophobe family protein n=1 Tax=Streptomyces sp. NPDC046915 TaxID=3155257 RepID=UPI0033D9CE72
MAVTTSRPRTRPGSGPGPRTTVPVRLIGPWQNALEGAAAALCGVAAMAAVSGLALVLLGAGSFGSLWSLTMTSTAMAVGGSVSAGPDASGNTGSTGGLASLFGGGGGLSPSMSGAAGVVPLGVTLTGAVVLWVAFSRRLRQGRQRRFTAGELAVRAAGAGAAALVTLMIVAGLAHGSADLPASAMTGGAGGGSAQGFGGGSGGLAGLFGGGGAAARPAMAYHVSAMSAGFGGLLWAAVVLGTGCLVSRRARLPLGGALDGLRSGWGRGLSPVVRTVLALAAVPPVALVFVGAMAGGRAATAAGAALLLAPNAVAVFLTLGVGSSWTAAVHPVRSEGGGNPLAALMGGMGGTAGTGGMGGGRQPDRTEHLRSLSAGGRPLWLVALAVTGLILLACAYRAARTTHPGHKRPLLPYRGPLSGHLGMAERFAVVTAVVLGVAAWSAGASGHFGVSMFGSEMGGMRAELSGSVLWTVVLGLFVGGAAGFAGSLLAAARRDRALR